MTDAEVAHWPALQQPDRAPRADRAVGGEALGFSLSAVERDDVPDALDADRVSPSDHAGGDGVRPAALRIDPLHLRPPSGVPLIWCDEVEPSTPGDRRFIGVDDGVVAEAVGAETAVRAAPAAEETEKSWCGDGALGDRWPGEPLLFVSCIHEFGVEDVLPDVSRRWPFPLVEWSWVGEVSESVFAVLVGEDWATVLPGEGGVAFGGDRPCPEVAVASEGHGIEGLDQVIEQAPFSGHPVNAWLAWEGDQPLSVVWLTVGRQIGVWAMMTPTRHRRRGAGRAVLSATLARTWSEDIAGSFLWSSPMGRPLYESLGYTVLDECWIWVLGGTEEMLAILGNT